MRTPEPSNLQRDREAAIMRAVEPSKSQLAREAASIERIVGLIRSRIAPAGDDPIKNEGEVIANGNTYVTEFLVEYTVIFLQCFNLTKTNRRP